MIRKLALPLLVALALSGCGNLFDTAAAVVYGEKISVEEVRNAVEDFQKSPAFEQLAQEGDADAITRDFEQSLLGQLIRRAVLAPEAEAHGVEVTDEEVQEQLDGIKAEFPSQSAFEEALREQGLTEEQLVQLIADRALEEKLREAVSDEIGPTDEEIKAYYEENQDNYSETSAQHILVENRGLADRIAAEIQQAPSPKAIDKAFDRLAKQHSIDESNKSRGGDLGAFKPGDFVPEFEQAADDLAIGEVSDPVKTEFGWHVIRVTDRRVAPLEEVEDQISDRLTDLAWEEWFEGVYRAADIVVNPRYGEFNLETQQVEDASPRTVPGAEETPPEPGSPEPTLAP